MGFGKNQGRERGEAAIVWEDVKVYCCCHSKKFPVTFNNRSLLFNLIDQPAAAAAAAASGSGKRVQALKSHVCLTLQFVT